jgi:hypothetical protein
VIEYRQGKAAEVGMEFGGYLGQQVDGPAHLPAHQVQGGRLQQQVTQPAHMGHHSASSGGT